MIRVCSFLAAALALSLSASAKIWRVNNNPGVVANFVNTNDAVASASVVNGDTLYIEPSATNYNGISLSKRLVFIGAGYLLDPANSGNAGLQVGIDASYIGSVNLSEGSNGSRFLGISFSSISFGTFTTAVNVNIERCYFGGGIFLSNSNYSNISVRKSFFNNARIEGTQGTISNFTCENNIFYSTFAYLNLTTLTGSNNIFRNNSFKDVGATLTLVNAYLANNIFGCTGGFTLTNTTIKNNLFATNVTLPGTATNNQLSVNMTNVYEGTTGGLDNRMKLKAGSPAIGAGLTVGSVTNPDCGAFGATDPYKISGIPNIPTIYSLTVPMSIPSGSPTMNVTLSTRNNN